MGLNKTIRDIGQTVEGMYWDASHLAGESFSKLKDSRTARLTAELALLLSGGAAAAVHSPATAQPNEKKIPYCDFSDTESKEKKNVLNNITSLFESGQYNMFSVVVRQGETIEEAIRAYATTWAVQEQREQFTRQALDFVGQVYGPEHVSNRTYSSTRKVPVCAPIDGCSSDEVIRIATSPVPSASLEERARTEESETATSEAAIGSGERGRKKTDEKKTDTETTEETTGSNDEGYDSLTEGNNPAAIFSTAIGQYIEARDGNLTCQVGAGPIFGVAERTDNDIIEIRDPVTGDLMGTESLEKVLESDITGWYANAFARIGDSTLLSLNIQNINQDGTFSIEGEDVSDYTREDLTARLGMRRGLKKWDGKAVITGDIFLGYEQSKDRGSDASGDHESSTELYGIGGGLNGAFRLSLGDFEFIPGLGLGYSYFSDQDEDMHTLLWTKAGVFDIKLSELLSMGVGYTLNIDESTNSDKELDHLINRTHNIGLQATLRPVGNNGSLGFSVDYFAGTHEEDFAGDLLDIEGDITGYGLKLTGSYPLGKSAVGMSLGVKHTEVRFADNAGDSSRTVWNIEGNYQF